MSYGYNPTTHTPEGYVRTGRTQAVKTIRKDDSDHLWKVLHGYAPGTYAERKAAYETLKARGVNV